MMTSNGVTCQYVKGNDEKCKRSVSIGQTLCWQHARGWSRWRSLTLGHKLAILSILVAIVFGVQRILSSGPVPASSVNVQSSGDNSPNVVGNSGKVDIQTGQTSPKKQKTGTQK
jgi:hypothetical protein